MDVDTQIGPLSGGAPKPGFISAHYNTLRRELKRVLGGDEQTRREQIGFLGHEWLEACRRGVGATIKIFIDGGMDINYQHPRTGQTALHAAAGSEARQTVRVLLRSEDCNYLLRDSKGRLPSECAYLFGEDVALSRLLGNKERKQAAEQGIELTRRS